MGVTVTRAVGIKAGETVLTEEQVLAGYEVSIRQASLADETKSWTGTAADAFSSWIYQGGTSILIVLMAEINGAIFQLGAPLGGFNQDIHVPAYVMLGLPGEFTGWRVKNRVAGKNALYTLTWFFLG